MQVLPVPLILDKEFPCLSGCKGIESVQEVYRRELFMQCVQFILSLCIPSMIVAMEQLEHYPLHNAACRGDLTMVKHLVEKERVDVNAVIFDGMSALHYAAKAGHDTVVFYLLCHGAKNFLAARGGILPVHFAAERGNVPILRSLIQYCDRYKKMADPNVRDSRGYTPVHYAAQKGHLAAVGYLHLWGAYLDCVAKDGKTPLKLARDGKYESVVLYLALNGHDDAGPLRAKL